MTRGTVKVGGTDNAPTDLNAKTDKQILIGNGTDVVSVAVSGDVTISNLGAVTIGNDKVSNAKLANMATMTIKGNNTGATADPIDLTVAQTKAMLDIDDLETALTAHLSAPLPHKMLVDGVAYNYGFSQTDGFVKFLYEEVE